MNTDLEIPLPSDLVVEPVVLVRPRAQRRLRGIGGTLLALLAIVGVRGAQLCVFPHAETIAEAGKQRWQSDPHPGRRGSVFDRDGRRLAATVESPNVYVDPSIIRPGELDALAEKVARILELPVEEVHAKMSRSGQYARLAQRVHPAIAAEIRAMGHRAVGTQRGAKRFYPQERLAGQVVGFVDWGGRGRTGIERTMDDSLRGGTVLLHRRQNRYGLALEQVRARDDVMGLNVHTTLDSTIQRLAEKALEQVVEDSDPVAGSIVVMDVATGDVLAMASAPSFNPNDVGSDAASQTNHAIQDAPEPGSIIKPFAIAAAVEEGIADTSTWIDCENGRYKIGRTPIHDDHPHSVVTVSEVLKYSSNIGTAKLTLQLGAEKFLDYMKRFGFGRRSGIKLPSERGGRLRRADRIKPIELATTSYGQGMTATPIQVAAATATLARGGVYMRPRLVSRVEDVHGVPEYMRTPVAGDRVISPKTADAIARALVTVTEPGGTATRARVPGYQVAAKTGTAEKVVDGRYSATARVASMMGFVPADRPEVAIVVMIDEPRKGSRYGGTVAGPAFAAVAAGTLRHLGIAPDPALMGEPEAVAELEPIEPESPVRLAWNGSDWTVPDFRGQSVRSVLRGLEGTGLAMDLSGTGRAIQQTPAPGARIPPGERVAITFQ